MTPSLDPSTPHAPPAIRAGWGSNRPLWWQMVKLALAALLAYAIWRGYQNPDLILDYGAWRLC